MRNLLLAILFCLMAWHADAGSLLLLSAGGGSACGPATTGNLITGGLGMTSGWAGTRATLTTGLSGDPCSGSTAAKLVEDTTATATHVAQQASIAFADSTTYTCDIYVNRGSSNNRDIKFFISDTGFVNYVDIVYDASTGAVLVAAFANGSIVSTSGGNSTNAGAGWFRIGITVSTGVGAALNTVTAALYNGSQSYTGDGASGLSLWGPTCRVGSSP